MPSLLSRLFGEKAYAPASEAKRSRANALLALHASSAAWWTPRNYVALTQQGYDRNAIVYRAVRMIAEGAASIPWRLYEHGGEIETHPLLDLFARPNPTTTGTELVEALVSNLLLFGNAYLEAASIDGAPRELYALRPDPGERRRRPERVACCLRLHGRWKSDPLRHDP